MIARRSFLISASALAAMMCCTPAAIAATSEFEEIALWPGAPPGRGGPSGPEKIGASGAGLGAVSNVSTPRMRVYRPAQPNGTAIVVCAGGGYDRLSLRKESTPTAKLLQAHGYTVFELIYRLPGDGWEVTAPFMDAQRAMKIVRSRAAEFGIKSDQVGIMGFSAGGHLAGFTALQPSRKLYTDADGFEVVSARPDFAVLLFPVVSLREPYTNTRMRGWLIGKNPSRAAEDAWSLDTYASANAPPIIIFSAADDTTTPPGHGIGMFEALKAAGASAELHIFNSGGHAWGLGTPDQVISQWPSLFEKWFQTKFQK